MMNKTIERKNINDQTKYHFRGSLLINFKIATNSKLSEIKSKISKK